MTSTPLTEPQPPVSFKLSAIYIGTDYPNLIQGQQYKLDLHYCNEATWYLYTSKDDAQMFISGLYDIFTNFTQICKI